MESFARSSTLARCTLLLLARPIAGCSSEDSHEENRNPAAENGAPAGTLPEAPTPCPSESSALLCPPDAAEGLQLRIEGTVAAGAEKTLCTLFEVPEAGFDVSRFEHRYSGPSHHFLVYRTTLTTEQASNYPGVFECAAAEEFGMSVAGVLFAAQQPSSTRELPNGVASRAPGKQILLLEYHLINSAADEAAAEARLNLYFPTEPPRAVAGNLFFYDTLIWVPPLSSSSAAMRCAIPKDLTLLTAASHMHRRGVHFEAWLDDAGLGTRELLYETDTWNEAIPILFDEPKHLRQGQIIEFRCDYDNPDPVAVEQGLSAETDEMCLFAGQYFTDDGLPLTADEEWCRTGPGPQGSGTRNCSEVHDCIQQQINAAATDAQWAAYYDCQLEGCRGDTLMRYNAYDVCLYRAPCRDSCVFEDADGRTTVLADSAECVACATDNCAEVRTACIEHACP